MGSKHSPHPNSTSLHILASDDAEATHLLFLLSTHLGMKLSMQLWSLQASPANKIYKDWAKIQSLTRNNCSSADAVTNRFCIHAKLPSFILQHTMECKNLKSKGHLLSHLHSLVIHVIVRILQPLHGLSTKRQHAHDCVVLGHNLWCVSHEAQGLVDSGQRSRREHTSSDAFSKQPEAFLKKSFAVCELLTKKPCAKLLSSRSDCTWLKLSQWEHQIDKVMKHDNLTSDV